MNIYKSLSEKVMPPPLVLYFATCILRMVEQLHAIGIIHADVKPDNFLLGERWAPPRCPARLQSSANGGGGGALLCLLQVPGEPVL